jgi:hypothetical protein
MCKMFLDDHHELSNEWTSCHTLLEAKDTTHRHASCSTIWHFLTQNTRIQALTKWSRIKYKSHNSY